MRRDPGLQPERTRLAWLRTVLGLSGVALLAARLALLERLPLGLVAAVALWLAVLLVGQRRVTALVPARPELAGRPLPALALIVAGYAVLGLLLVLA